MFKVSYQRAVTTFAINIPVSYLVGRILKSFLPAGAILPIRIVNGVAVFLLSAYIADHVEKYYAAAFADLVNENAR